MSTVITGASPATTSVSGPGGTPPAALDVSVAGQAVRVVLLEPGVTIPPAGTPVPAILIQKGT